MEKKQEETKELGSWTREMIRPENLIGPFHSTQEMFDAILNDDDDDEDEEE